MEMRLPWKSEPKVFGSDKMLKKIIEKMPGNNNNIACLHPSEFFLADHEIPRRYKTGYYSIKIQFQLTIISVFL